MTTTPDWHPHGYEVSGAEDDLTDAQAHHVATGGRGHHLTGPVHYETAELAAERARDLLEGRDPRYLTYRDTTTEEDRDRPQETLEGQAWAAVAQAHSALAGVALNTQTYLTAGMLTEDDEAGWGLAIQ